MLTSYEYSIKQASFALGVSCHTRYWRLRRRLGMTGGFFLLRGAVQTCTAGFDNIHNNFEPHEPNRLGARDVLNADADEG